MALLGGLAYNSVAGFQGHLRKKEKALCSDFCVSPGDEFALKASEVPFLSHSSTQLLFDYTG